MQRERGAGAGGGGGARDADEKAEQLAAHGLDADPSYMSWTEDPDGNWSAPVGIFDGYAGADTNFAPLILANGSLVALWREWAGDGGSRVYVATAAELSGPRG